MGFFCLCIAALSACGLDDNNAPTSATASARSTVPGSSTTTSVPAIQLSGTPPASVVVGGAYQFQPTVVTTGGSATFSATGLPAWASVDPGTGEISGTPGSGDVGTSGAILLIAVDGSATASLPAFTITVTPPTTASTGSASLSWTAPTSNTNGTPITDLAGYHIYYGTTAGSLDTFIDVPGGATTEYEISNLASGTYYFTVTAYNSLGLESAASNQASKTI